MVKAAKGIKKIPPLPVRAARILRRLKKVPGMDDAEKSVHALGLAATPQERIDLHEKAIRSLGYWKPLKRKKSVRRSKTAVGRPKDKGHVALIEQFLQCRKRL